MTSCNKINGDQRRGGFTKTKVAQNHLKDISKILKSDKISPLPTLATVRGPI